MSIYIFILFSFFMSCVFCTGYQRPIKRPIQSESLDDYLKRRKGLVFFEKNRKNIKIVKKNKNDNEKKYHNDEMAICRKVNKIESEYDKNV